MNQSRRSLLGSMAVAIPLGIASGVRASEAPTGPAPTLRFRSFEESVREAFAKTSTGPESNWRRVEIGHSDEVRAGIQGCHNDREFAGFPKGHLRVIRLGSEPGPVRQGIRFYVTTVDVALTDGRIQEVPSRPLDFGSLPPAPVLC